MRSRRNIYAIIWKDAAYSSDERLHRAIPQNQNTVGFLIEKTKDYLIIACNVCTTNEISSTLKPIDGFMIPTKTVVKILKIGSLNIYG